VSFLGGEKELTYGPEGAGDCKSLEALDNDKERFYFCLKHMSELTEMPKEFKGNKMMEELKVWKLRLRHQKRHSVGTAWQFLYSQFKLVKV